MKLARREFFSLALGAASMPMFCLSAFALGSQSLAEQLARYAVDLRFGDIDPATVERVKAHVIDALGCGIAAFDERPVRASREVALAGA
jgi:2-methylcitrate dehydratase